MPVRLFNIRSLLAPAGQQFAGKRAIALGDSLTAGYGSPEYVDTSGKRHPAGQQPRTLLRADCDRHPRRHLEGQGLHLGHQRRPLLRQPVPALPHRCRPPPSPPTSATSSWAPTRSPASLGSIADAPVASDYAGASSFYAQMRGVIETTQEFNPAMRIIGLLPFQNGQ